MLNHFELIDSLFQASLKPFSAQKTRYLKKIAAVVVVVVVVVVVAAAAVWVQKGRIFSFLWG